MKHIIPFLLFLFPVTVVAQDRDYFSAYDTLQVHFAIDNEIPLGERAAHLVKDYLLVYNMHSDMQLISVFDRHSLSFLGEILQKGKEINQPGWLWADRNKNQFYLGDGTSIYKYQLPLDFSKPVIPIDTLFVPTSAGTFYNYVVDKDIIYSQSIDSENSMFNKISQNDNNTISLGNKPVYIEPEVELDQFWFIFEKNPTLPYFIVAFSKYDVLRVFDHDGNLIQHTTGQLNIRADIIKGLPIQAYRRVKSTEKYIYVEYVGENGVNEFTNKINFSKTIHIYDWELTPIRSIHLPNRFYSFEIDDVNNRIIVMEEPNSMTVFEFSESELYSD